jgi:hypothetical protein
MRRSSSSNNSQSTLFQKSSGNLAVPGGYLAPATIQTDSRDELVQTISFADKILSDPLLLRQLCDRVYELMLEDLRQQRERYRNYGELL